MKRGVIYTLGVVGLVLVAVVALPVTGRMIETQLQSEIDDSLADKGVTGIMATMDGQAVTLAYAKDAAKTVAVDDPGLLGPRMAWAVDAATILRGGVFRAPGHGGLIWGPVTQIEVDQPSVDALSQQIAARQKAKAAVAGHDVALARACTEDVAKAVAERKLNFISGSFDLTPDSEVILDDVYKVIAGCPGNLVLHVEGHTDNVGTDADNITLSSSRAGVAAEGLIERGLARDKVTSEGFGEIRPIDDNKTPKGQAANRRVMFIMVPPGAAP